MVRPVKIVLFLLISAFASLWLSACSTSSQDKFNSDYASFSRQQDKDWDRFFDAVMQ